MHKCLRHSIQPKAGVYSYLEPCHSWVNPRVKYCNDDPSAVKFRIRRQEFFCSCFTLGDQAMEWERFQRGVHQTRILYKIIYGQLMGNVSLQCACAKSVFAEKGWDCDGRKDIAEGIC